MAIRVIFFSTQELLETVRDDPDFAPVAVRKEITSGNAVRDLSEDADETCDHSSWPMVVTLYPVQFSRMTKGALADCVTSLQVALGKYDAVMVLAVYTDELYDLVTKRGFPVLRVTSEPGLIGPKPNSTANTVGIAQSKDMLISAVHWGSTLELITSYAAPAVEIGGYGPPGMVSQILSAAPYIEMGVPIINPKQPWARFLHRSSYMKGLIGSGVSWDIARKREVIADEMAPTSKNDWKGPDEIFSNEGDILNITSLDFEDTGRLCIRATRQITVKELEDVTRVVESEVSGHVANVTLLVLRKLIEDRYYVAINNNDVEVDLLETDHGKSQLLPWRVAFHGGGSVKDNEFLNRIMNAKIGTKIENIEFL